MVRAALFGTSGQLAAIAACTLALVFFTAGTRFWRNPALLATWLAFFGVDVALLSGLGFTLHWYPRGVDLWISGVVWWFLTVVWLFWCVAYVVEQDPREASGGPCSATVRGRMGHRAVGAHCTGIRGCIARRRPSR